MRFAHQKDLPEDRRSSSLGVNGTSYPVKGGFVTIPDADAIEHLEEIVAHGFIPASAVSPLYEADPAPTPEPEKVGRSKK